MHQVNYGLFLCTIREDFEKAESMLKRAPSQLTIKATSDVLLLRLSARRFRTLVSAYPEVVTHLKELARRPSAPALSLFPESQAKRPA